MFIYFLLIRIAALFGHRKARLMVEGQKQTARELKEWSLAGKHPIWFHAASVGEFEQARPIIEKIRLEHPEQPMLLTFFSPSGYEMRKNYDQVDKVIYLPFATRRRARRFLKVVQPRLAVFIKYEFWPAYLKELHHQKIDTYIVSAIFRPKQLFFLPWGAPYRHLLTFFRQIFVQDEESKELLAKFHIDNVIVAGDTRFDRVTAIAQKAKEIGPVLHFTKNHDKVIIAGSTWPQDEELLARYVRTHEDVRLVLVPHEIHEQHMHRIFEIFEGRYVRYTEATMNNLLDTRVLVLDTMGLLSSVYQYGHVAYVGGGFGVGIHNTIEAAVYGIPVLFGPNYHHFREAKGLIQAEAGYSVSDYASFEEKMDYALANHIELGRNAAAYVRSELGATLCVYDEIMK